MRAKPKKKSSRWRGRRAAHTLAPMNRDHPIICRAVSAGVALASIALAQGEPADLKPSLLPGYTYTYTHEQDVTTQMNFGGAAMDQKMDFEMVISMAVEEGGGEAAKKAVLKYDRLKADMEMMQQKLSFDSADPAGSNPLLGAAMGTITGATFTATLDADDKVLTIESEGLPEANPAAGGPLGGGDMGLGSETMESIIMGASGDGFPAEPVEPGHAWDHDIEMPVPNVGRMTVKMQYKFEGMEAPAGGGEKLPKVSFTGTLGEAQEVKLGTGGVGIKMDKLDTKGVMYFDPAQDIYSRVESESSLAMSMDNGETTMDIPVTQKAVMTAKRVKTAP
jgi:hypothetical protein